MEAILSALPALAQIIEKGGVVGVMLIACAALVWEIRRLRRREHKANDERQILIEQRDLALLKLVKAATICEERGFTLDLSDVERLLPKVTP